MAVETRKKKTIITKLLFAFRPKRQTNIVEYAEKIIDDYTGVTAIREKRRKRRMKRISFVAVSTSAIAFTFILWCILKIFF